MEKMTEVLKILKRKLPKTITFADDQLIECLSEVEQKILNYCHLFEVPDPLIYTWANITRDLIIYENDSLSEKSDIEVSGAITSIKEGDTQISYGSDVSIANKHNMSNVIDGLLFNYKADLKRFRKIEWQ